ncbi:DNA endonuclease [Spirulina sp. CS-785/01]|uniref:DNA endonuclease n=1 Tax=Spirulina sp. CS-785/01 TaxID=3021716 RepID=UPI0023300965|nr:DNA endonuclease [Spirulina sp. CS-785/01]MDB9312767.1 DNA endonuclease [Spirulina sp. CS-785/01]
MDFDVSSKKEKRGLLAGMLLGKGRKRQDNFFIQHDDRQRGYLFFKKELLEQITRKPVGVRSWSTAKGNRLWRIDPKLIPLTRIMLKRLYSGNTRQVTRSFLEGLTPQGIAIWFMDCGSRSFKRDKGKIRALEVFLNTGLSPEANEVIVAYFAQVWGIHWGLSRNGSQSRLRLGTKAGKAFFGWLSPFIHPSMQGKINPSYNETATTYGKCF